MKTDKYHIRFFRVGDASKGGDAIVIEVFDVVYNPHIAIIDGGYADDGQRIVDYLVNKYSISPVSILTFTHLTLIVFSLDRYSYNSGSLFL